MTLISPITLVLLVIGVVATSDLVGYIFLGAALLNEIVAWIVRARSNVS